MQRSTRLARSANRSVSKLWLGALVMGLAACGDGDGDGTLQTVQPAQSAAAVEPGAFVQGEALVQFRPGVSRSAMAAARGRAGARLLETIDTEQLRASGQGPLELVQVPPGLTVADAVRAIAADPAVRFAEPNFIYTTQQVTAPSNDPQINSLWGMHNTGQSINGGAVGTADADIDAPEAWALSTGSPTVYIGIIDEGVDYRHPDLANAVINPLEDIAAPFGEITAADLDGRDNDGNGRIDDVRGWDFDGKNNSIYDGRNATDSTTDSHGTHVAGTIAGRHNNGIGVAGVAGNVRLISAKFLGSRGGTTANSILAVDYLTGLRTRGVNIIASNNSWGGGGYSQALRDAIERANTAGILFVAAAGNGGSDGVGDNNDTVVSYPGNYNNTNVISVAAFDNRDRLGTFSNYGATMVDVAAPGVTILSTTPNGTYVLLPHNSPRFEDLKLRTSETSSNRWRR